MWVSIIYFPSYTGQNFWGTICKIPCTSRDHISGPKFIIKKKKSFNPFSHKYGAIKIEVHAKVFNAPGITSVEQKFPNRKLFQSYMHPLSSPILLLTIQALALAHNFWTANKAQLQELNNHYNNSHDDDDYDYGGAGNVHKINEQCTMCKVSCALCCSLRISYYIFPLCIPFNCCQYISIINKYITVKISLVNSKFLINNSMSVIFKSIIHRIQHFFCSHNITNIKK